MPTTAAPRPSVIASLPAANGATIRANAPQIAPLLTQLEELRDRIRATM